jgi:hypothetical protein
MKLVVTRKIQTKFQNFPKPLCISFKSLKHIASLLLPWILIQIWIQISETHNNQSSSLKTLSPSILLSFFELGKRTFGAKQVQFSLKSISGRAHISATAHFLSVRPRMLASPSYCQRASPAIWSHGSATMPRTTPPVRPFFKVLSPTRPVRRLGRWWAPDPPHPSAMLL